MNRTNMAGKATRASTSIRALPLLTLQTNHLQGNMPQQQRSVCPSGRCLKSRLRRCCGGEGVAVRESSDSGDVLVGLADCSDVLGEYAWVSSPR